MEGGEHKQRELATVGQRLCWAYACLGMAHAALSKGRSEYVKMDYIIRNRLYNGLLDGSMKLGSLRDDERLKLQLPRVCCYCGQESKLTLDHLIPSLTGGADSADNIVWACRSCNSSKGASDVLEWHGRTGRFPPLLLLRRYLKLAITYCVDNGYVDLQVSECPQLPFSLAHVPERFPDLGHLRLWDVPMES